MERLTRRDALRAGIRAAAPVSALSYTRVLGANDRINIGVIGCGNRGSYLLDVFRRFPDVRGTAVCDVFGEKCDRAAQSADISIKTGDHRRLLERRDVDAVVIATPDHWHAQIAVDAMHAGKDVYVEKPLAFRLQEGPAIIRAARSSGRICQVGLQQRSGDVFLSARQEIIDAGLLGNVSMVRTVWHCGPPYDLGDRNELKPAGLDWTRFLGQVSMRPWNPHQYHHWRLYSDFGGGCMTDLLVHWIDALDMVLGPILAKSVTAAGGIFVARDDRTVPDTANVLIDCDGFTVTFESASVAGMPGEHMVLSGTRGQLWINRLRYEYTPCEADSKPVVFRGPGYVSGIARQQLSRLLPFPKASELRPEEGRRSSQVCLLAKEAYRSQARIRLRKMSRV